MKFARRARQDIDVNMMPLIDVVFLLLIFFMVSTTFTKESRLGLNLPKAVVGEKTKVESNHVELQISGEGVYSIEGNSLTNNDRASVKSALRKQLELKLSNTKESTAPSLTITADAATAHQFVITAMDVAGQLGFSKLSITTLKQDK